MACVILPSETARLVYGYLVKENLNDIALQFLERSPYLMDCCQIVKSGYQFNTKLMGKDLPELLQEYSVIHNLVNSKIGLLCKTSLLYKRIKLRCENLPEILELILFWKYKNSKTEESSASSEKIEKIEKLSISGLEVSTNCEYPNLGDVSQTKISENPSDNTCLKKNNDSNCVSKICATSETFSSKLNCETYSVDNVIERHERCDSQVQINELHGLENDKNNRKSSLYMPVQNDELSENTEKNKNNVSSNTNSNKNNNNDDDNNNNNNNNNNDHDNDNDNKMNNSSNDHDKVNHLQDPKFSSNANILAIDVDTPCEALMNDGVIPTDSLVPAEEPNRYENPIKIVGIQEEHQNENHALSVFSKPLEENGGHLNLENSSVVFVSNDVGNMAINQEENQIIVIPFDYYKPQNGLQNEMDIDHNKDLNLISNEVVNHPESNIIFEERAVNGISTSPHLFGKKTGKRSTVDENIMTENDFLRNQHLMYNLEKELYKPDHSTQSQLPKEPEKPIPSHTVSGPVIVVSQSIPVPTQKYRSILPKIDPPETHPVVVIHPLLESNTDLTKTRCTARETFLEVKSKRTVNRRVKKKNMLFEKTKTKESEKSESVKEPTSKEALKNEVVNEIQTDLPKVTEKQIDIEVTNEEKENLEKTENKKNETPVFVTKRNSKRLSLSTPRRRTHIRALEFETPPKTNDNKKKSKTSPKIKVEQVKVQRKSVRNTLFKSPIPEDSFKSPVVSNENKKVQPNPPESGKILEAVEPLNELSIPIATRSPNSKLSDVWENLTGVGCVIGQNESSKVSPTKKMWDADLRCFILDNNPGNEQQEKKRSRKPEKNQKDNRKSTKKKINPSKRIKPIPVTVSPSKISLTAKRNTYSINGNEEGSPIRTLIDDLKIVTPFKDVDTIRPTEETPLTKLLRENVNTIDIDLSMINTPSFPPTPSILITPDLDDASMTGTNYYSPTKDCSRDKVLKITDYFKVESEKTNKKETKEMHDKVIDDLVSKAKEIIGLGKESQEENSMKRRPSGKILSMVKIQMLTQCDKKLMENIPINEESSFPGNLTNQTILGNVIEATTTKADLKIELEEKRKRALKKIKVVKENLSQAKNKVSSRNRKRKRSENMTKSDRSRSDVSKESVDEKQENLESDESVRKESQIFHSTPYAKGSLEKLEKTDSDKKMSSDILDDIRQQFPPFLNDTRKFPELSEKSRKKIHYVENFLKLPEIVKYIEEFSENNQPKLFLKLSLRRFFHVFYKWLKHPHKRELNASRETNALLKEYLALFEKVNTGLSHKSKRFKKENETANASGLSYSHVLRSNGSKAFQSEEEEERKSKKRGSEKVKEEDTEDGVVSTLPLKKRKSTVQQVENKTAPAIEKNDLKNSGAENVSQTQNFLQDIDVDRFLSQIHGQETR